MRATECGTFGNTGEAMTAKKTDPFVGREILDGQFRIVQRIGAGGMGSVYRAHEPSMGREVAIKILHPNLKGRSDLVSRFRREARAMSQLKHPNTVRVFMYGELEDGSLYIVMEMLEGKNLNQTVRKGGPMAPSRAIPIVCAACRALHEAHEMGIVHRDLKPENIFVCEQPEKDYAKVLDFGLAKVTEAQMRPGSMILTQEGMVFGTPEFMSPEQARGSTLDARSDIYSLACILYEALTGKLPFIAKTPMEYVGKHVTAPPIPLSERVEGRTFPEGLGKVIEKALAKNPADRFQTALELSEALEPYADGTGALAPPARVAPLSSPVAAAPLAAAGPAAGPTVTTLVGVAVACMVIGGLGAFWLMNLLGK
jgi:serine/threonine protein kinase